VASLIEELMSTLENEISEYKSLLELSEKKTPILVSGDMEQLRILTDEEQAVADRIVALDAKRASVTRDIADVLNTDVDSLKLSVLVDILKKQPEESKRLADIRDRLQSVVHSVKMVNDNNRELIKTSLDIVEFDLNLIKSMRQAPETNNYGRTAINDGSFLGGTRGGFDAKQ